MNWSLIPHWLKLTLAAILAAFLLSAGSYQLGKYTGRQQAAVSAAKVSIKAYQERPLSMARYRIWMLLACVLSLAGCSSTASNCAGWQQIKLKPQTAVYLAGNDLTAGQGVAAHNQYGNKAGCW